MAVKNKPTGLGRGLSAIFDMDKATSTSQTDKMIGSEGISQLDIECITPNPNQPRKDFDQEQLQELSESIKTYGLVQPITVRRVADNENRFVIISGERRYRAAKMAGISVVPVYLREVDDNVMLEMALVENIQRQDLNAMEVAVSLQRLMEECDITQESLADRVGKKRSTVANYIRLLRLPPEVQLAIKKGLISMGHARALVAVGSEQMIVALLEKILKNNLSVRQTEEMIRNILQKQDPKKNKIQTEYPVVYSRLVEKLEFFMGEDITIKRNAAGKGKIVIGFKSEQQIDEIVRRLDELIGDN